MWSELSVRRIVLLIVGVLFFFSCGGSMTGAGTQTLYVKAQALTDGTTDGSWLAVEVREGRSDGPLVTDAIVTLQGDRSGLVTVPWEGMQVGAVTAGAYRLGGLVWDSGWELRVDRGSDHLDAYLTAPGVSTITGPLAGTTFNRADGLPLHITWKDDAGRRAELVELKLDHAEQASVTLPQDTLGHEVEANRLVATDKEKIDLKRRNAIPLGGGVEGSVFSATTQHRIEIAVQ